MMPRAGRWMGWGAWVLVAAGSLPAQSYLPLAQGTRWVLRNRAMAQPVTFEVARQGENGSTFRSTTPWGSSEWTLSARDGQYLMTQYGGAALPNRPVYLDFTRPAGTRWTNPLGTITVVARDAVVQSKTRTYRDCIQIRHRAGKTDLLYTFARDVGYVQFGEGGSAFVIDEAASVLPGASHPGTGAAAATGAALSTVPATPPAIHEHGGVLVGITPNRFANEPMTLDVMLRRFRQTVELGAGFMVGNGTWTELEPKPDRYELASVNTLVSTAGSENLALSYTLRIIDTRRKVVPADLSHKSWHDPALRARLLALLDRIVPVLRPRARWLMVGYELDAYFRDHPAEIRDFLELYQAAASRVKQLAPEMRVSATLEFGGIAQLESSLSGLNRQLDFVAFTYSPLNPDFTAKDPAVVHSDLAEIRRVAAGRKIVLQEVGYPTSADNHSNNARQAQFYTEFFQDLERDPAAFAAVNVMTLADLGERETEQYTSVYGLKSPAFRGALQTLGLFDQNGQPKPALKVIEEQIPVLEKSR
ncbi:MAG TPA: hypothetical protein VKV17_10575 [Bryobacteraceae bacterium]|nr:hypothetical protein [Bryobacteraceae bacterium]